MPTSAGCASVSTASSTAPPSIVGSAQHWSASPPAPSAPKPPTGPTRLASCSTPPSTGLPMREPSAPPHDRPIPGRDNCTTRRHCRSEREEPDGTPSQASELEGRRRWRCSCRPGDERRRLRRQRWPGAAGRGRSPPRAGRQPRLAGVGDRDDDPGAGSFGARLQLGVRHHPDDHCRSDHVGARPYCRTGTGARCSGSHPGAGTTSRPPRTSPASNLRRHVGVGARSGPCAGPRSGARPATASRPGPGAPRRVATTASASAGTTAPAASATSTTTEQLSN